VINLQKLVFKKHFELLVERCLGSINNSAEADCKFHLHYRILISPLSPAGFPLELHYNLFQNLVHRTIAITLKATNFSVNIIVAIESPHSTRIGQGRSSLF
jgi:hypothetical protein